MKSYLMTPFLLAIVFVNKQHHDVFIVCKLELCYTIFNIVIFVYE